MEAASNVAFGLVIFGVLLVIYVATGNVNQDLQSPDAVAAALPAWHLVTAHSLYLDKVPVPNIWVHPGAGHHIVSNRQPGVVFFGVPFYWLLGHGSSFTMFPAVVAAATSAAGAVALLATTLRDLVGTRWALLAGAVLAFGTSTWSVSADTLWPHGPDQLFLAAAIFFLARGRLGPASLAIALAVPVRAHLAVVALVAGVWYAVRRRSARPLITFGLPSAVSIAAVEVYNHWLFGAWSLNGGYATYVTKNVTTLSEGLNKASLPVNIAGSFFSLDRGLFIWCPLVLVLLLTLRPAWRAAPDWVRISSIGGVLYFLIQMKLNYFSGGDRFWSYRLMIEPLTLNVPLLVLAARELPGRDRRLPRIALAASIYCIGTQAIGAIFYRPDNIAHSPWFHSKLWQELSSGGAGPVAVASLTAVAIAAALWWPRRTADALPLPRQSTAAPSGHPGTPVRSAG